MECNPCINGFLHAHLSWLLTKLRFARCRKWSNASFLGYRLLLPSLHPSPGKDDMFASSVRNLHVSALLHPSYRCQRETQLLFGSKHLRCIWDCSRFAAANHLRDCGSVCDSHHKGLDRCGAVWTADQHTSNCAAFDDTAQQLDNERFCLFLHFSCLPACLCGALIRIC